MRTTIDGAGRVVIPKDLRERLGLTGGTEIEVSERDGLIEIAVAPTPMKLIQRKGHVVAVTERPMPELTDEMIRETIDRSRR